MKDCIIECPRCGRQYHFQEIVMPATIFQHVAGVIRDKNGKVIDIIGDKSTNEEFYFCDTCDAPLKIKVKLSFEVNIDNKYDFTTDYATVLK